MAEKEVARLNIGFALLLSAVVLLLVSTLVFALYTYLFRPAPTHNPGIRFLCILGIFASLGFIRQAAYLLGSVFFAKARGLYFTDTRLVFVSPRFRSVSLAEVTGVQAIWKGGKRQVKWEYIQIDRRDKPPLQFLARLLRKPSGEVVRLCQAELASRAQ